MMTALQFHSCYGYKSPPLHTYTLHSGTSRRKVKGPAEMAGMSRTNLGALVLSMDRPGLEEGFATLHKNCLGSFRLWVREPAPPRLWLATKKPEIIWSRNFFSWPDSSLGQSENSSP